MIELVHAGGKPEELADEFGCSAQSIRNWVAQAAIDGGKPIAAKNRLSSAERKELARLRRQVRQLQTERDILAKATAWFAGRNGNSSNS
jgi:transposase